MVTRRPHILRYSVTSQGERYMDENGNWQFPPIVSVDRELKCRVEDNANRSQPGNVNDGVSFNYTYLIFAETPEEVIAEGTRIEAFNIKTNGQIMSGEVQMFSLDQRQCRIWV